MPMAVVMVVETVGFLTGRDFTFRIRQRVAVLLPQFLGVGVERLVCRRVPGVKLAALFPNQVVCGRHERAGVGRVRLAGFFFILRFLGFAIAAKQLTGRSAGFVGI